jgi:hypothetical protein
MAFSQGTWRLSSRALQAINDARRDLLVPSLPNLAVALLLPGSASMGE